MNFYQKLQHAWKRNNSLLCVGLDPDPAKLPLCLSGAEDAIFQFSKAIIDATHDLVCAFKPQIAYFAAHSAEDQLEKIIKYSKDKYPHIPIILDSKRGDIGSTATMYAIEAFSRYNADAITVNPYMGFDAVKPFTDYENKGVVLLCRTSNPGAADIQDLIVDGIPVYEKLATTIVNDWNHNNNCLLVVGATWPKQMSRIRTIVGDDMAFLVPGVGAQGGNIEQLVTAGQTNRGTGLIINSSRSILYASAGSDFADASRKEALSLRDEINKHRTIA